MGLRQPSVGQGPQGLLPFDFDASDATNEVTGRAGLPLLLETMMALRVGQAVKQHVKLRKRNAGFSEAEMVEDLVLLLGAGGECLDDLAILAADKGLLRLCHRDNLPARLVSHARRLLARVARSLLERADLLVGRARLRVAHAA
jgi:hypothetical protein